MIGTVVGDKYRILRRLGAGGMGTVYEAEHLATSRSVALKVLSRDLTEEPSQPDLSDSMRARQEEVLERFRREALAAGRIRSEHVVQILDAGQDLTRDSPFLVMEMLEGESLQQTCKRLRQLAPEAALKIAVHACRGLVAAHEAGVVHRDIKSANLLLSQRSDGEIVVKVLDFGIAKVRMEQFQAGHEGGLTHTGTMLGSPHYMSPEQAKGLRTVDHRADVWSLGVVLYRMLTGANPFEAASLGQVLLAICTEEPVPLASRAPWVSPSVVAIVGRTLRKDPGERFSTARELLQALEAELPGGTTLRPEQVVGLSDAQRAMVPDPASLAAQVKSPPAFDSASRPVIPAHTASEPDTRMGFPRDAAPSKRGGGVGPLLGVGLAAVLGVGGGFYAFSRAGVGGEAAPGAPVTAAAVPGASASAATSAAAAPLPTASAAPDATREVRLGITSPDAVVLVEGKRVPVTSGAVTLRGALGSIVNVTLSRRGKAVELQVVISEQGPVPDAVGFDTKPAPPVLARPSVVTAPAVAGAPTPAPASTTPAPAKTAKPGVGATNTFD